MFVRCRTIKGSDLGEFRRGLYYTPETRFTSLRVNDVYRVFGLTLYQNTQLATKVDPRPAWFPPQAGLTVLIGHEYDNPPTIRPDWYPIELFSVEDSKLPDDWEFSTTMEYSHEGAGKSNVLARWGYPLLVHSDEHWAGLVERDPPALAAFRAEYERRAREEAGI